ncbi:MAG: cell wall hydrolase [Lachnospiraceae bacterium]|nr:cell wall hydrolase [Lachnospiraceae bacterium]MDD3661076.1 cell wall hydrolase [Lachnospiraceae bacterium]
MTNRMVKRFSRQMAVILAVAILSVSLPQKTFASASTLDKINQAQKEKGQTESQLNETKGQIDSLEGIKNGLQGELSNLNSELTEVSDNLETLENEIEQKEEDISITQQELEEARKTEEWQYTCMKERIKFMYERGENAYLEIFFAADNFSDFLNKTEYVNKVSEYDRKMLIEYQETKKQIEEQEAMLQSEKAELDKMQEEAKEQQAKVSQLINQTSDHIVGYANQISDAERVALAYENKIKEQESNIAALKKQYEQELAMSRLAAQSAKRDISEVAFAEGDLKLLATIIYCEAGGEPYAGKLAVGAVVINRLLSSVYPDTVVGVIYQRKQFSPVGSGRFDLALANGTATQSCYQAAQEAMSGATNVGNCVYFRTPIEGLTGIQIGGHIFY